MNKLELKEFKKKHNLSLQDIADITKVTIGAVKSWESGQRNISQSAIALLELYIQNQPNNIQEEAEDAQTAVIGQRLAEYAAMQGVNIKEFAAKCGLNYNNTASLLKGSMPLGLGVLGKIKKGFPALNTEWVLYGNGTIELGGAAPNNAAIEQMQQVVTLLQGSLKDKDKTIAGLEKQVALMEQLQELTDKKDQSPVKSTVG